MAVLREFRCSICGRVQEAFVYTNELRPGVKAESANLERCCEAPLYRRVLSAPAIRGDTVAKS